MQVAGHSAAIVALIEVEAGLLTFGQIDAVAQTVFDDEDRALGGLAPVQPVAQLDALGRGHAFFGADVDAPRLQL